MAATTVRNSFREVGQAIRRPEQLARRWRDRFTDAEAAPSIVVFLVLLANAAFGTAVYGMFMHMHRGIEGMTQGAVLFPLAAGVAWAVAFPALYIINRVLGSKLDFTTTALAASITVSFGATAMLASVPVTWFFSLAVPFDIVRWGVNLVIFAGVGIAMIDVLLRILRAVEPNHSLGYPFIWLMLLATLGAQLFALFGLFQF